MIKFQKTKTNRLNCPIQLTSNVLGDKWVLLILRELFLGNTKFNEFQTNLRISKSVLTSKLKSLESAGLVVKEKYQEDKERVRYEYFLSNKGGDLVYILGSISIWGNANLVNKNDSFLRIVDKEGNPVKVAFVDVEGNNLGFDEIKFDLVQ